MAESIQCPRCGCGLTQERLRLGPEVARANARAMMRRFKFTPRQLQTLELLIEGHSNKEIGLRMGNTEQVVKNRIKAIFDITGQDSRNELMAMLVFGDKPER
jgi:DNA-binding NarL/FixJ family response regulator